MVEIIRWVQSRKRGSRRLAAIAILPAATLAYLAWSDSTYANYLRYRLGYSTNKAVIVGRDGWLFYNQTSITRRYIGADRLSSPQIDTWADHFAARVERYRQLGTQFYFLIAPLKQSVYPELMPDGFDIASPSEDEILVENASRKVADRVIHPLAELRDAKSQRKVYAEYDTHWNAFGAYIAYKALISAIAKNTPEVGSPLPIDAFSMSRPQGYLGGGDLAFMLKIFDHVPRSRPTFTINPTFQKRVEFLDEAHDVNRSPRIVETTSKNGLTLLLIRDSFSMELLPLLEAHFRRIVFVYFADGFDRQDLIERYRPDVTVLEIVGNAARFTMGPT